MPYKDPLKRRQVLNNWRARNRDRVNNTARIGAQKRNIRNRKLVLDYKIKHGCYICGESEPVCLDFHHKNPNEKRIEVALGIYRHSIETLQKEIDKCILLCSNCHRKVHHGKLSIHES